MSIVNPAGTGIGITASARPAGIGLRTAGHAGVRFMAGTDIEDGAGICSFCSPTDTIGTLATVTGIDTVGTIDRIARGAARGPRRDRRPEAKQQRCGPPAVG